MIGVNRFIHFSRESKNNKNILEKKQPEFNKDIKCARTDCVNNELKLELSVP